MIDLDNILLENPIIAAVRSYEDLKKSLGSNASVVFVLFGDILNIKDICSVLHEKNKIVFVHVDLIQGLKGEDAGIKYIKECANPYGIISTKASIIKSAKQLGLYTVQRLFIIDSLSLKTGIKSIHSTNPNAVELMPGIVTKTIKYLQKEIKPCIIAGGLISDKKDIMDALGAGAVAISTGKEQLWNL